MSEFIYAIIGLIIGGAVGILIGSMCAVSKKADEDADKSLNSYIKRNYGIDCDPKIKMSRCPHCGTLEGGAMRVL